MAKPLSSTHKCNTTTIQLQYKNFFLYCSCIELVRTTAIQCCNTYNASRLSSEMLALYKSLTYLQVFYNLPKTCRLLAAVVKNLYCSWIALLRSAAIQQNFCVMLLWLYCACAYRFTYSVQELRNALSNGTTVDCIRLPFLQSVAGTPTQLPFPTNDKLAAMPASAMFLWPLLLLL